MFAVGGAASLRRYNHPMSASISPARRELTQLSATETNALPEDLLRAILSYVSRSGARELTVLPGRVYGLDGTATVVGNGQRSLKSILRPLRSRVIKCPDDIPLLEDAVAAAGTKCDAKRDVVLLTKSDDSHAVAAAEEILVSLYEQCSSAERGQRTLLHCRSL